MSKLKNLDSSYAEKEPNLAKPSDYTMYHLKLSGVTLDMIKNPRIREQYAKYLEEQEDEK